MKKHLVKLHFIAQVLFLAYIGYAVHWSVALFLAWLSISIYSLNERNIRMFAATKENYELKIEKSRLDILGKIQQAAQNTVVNVVGRVKQQHDFMQPVPPRVNPDRPKCLECLEDPVPGAVIYNEGNCPIHD